MRFAASLKESVKQRNLKNVRKNPHFAKDTTLGRPGESAEVAQAMSFLPPATVLTLPVKYCILVAEKS
jgi:hypothetical protein